MIINIKNNVGLEHFDATADINVSMKLGVVYKEIQDQGMSSGAYDRLNALSPGILGSINPKKLTVAPSQTLAKESLVALEFSKEQVMVGIGAVSLFAVLATFIRWVIGKMTGDSSGGGGGGSVSTETLKESKKNFADAIVKVEKQQHEMMSNKKVNEVFDKITVLFHNQVASQLYLLMSNGGKDTAVVAEERAIAAVINKLNFKTVTDGLPFILKSAMHQVLFTPLAIHNDVIGAAYRKTLESLNYAASSVIPASQSESDMKAWRSRPYDNSKDLRRILTTSKQGKEVLAFFDKPEYLAHRLSIRGIMKGSEYTVPTSAHVDILSGLLKDYATDKDGMVEFLNIKDSMMDGLNEIITLGEGKSPELEKGMSAKDHAMFKERFKMLKQNISDIAKMTVMLERYIKTIIPTADAVAAASDKLTKLLEKQTKGANE